MNSFIIIFIVFVFYTNESLGWNINLTTKKLVSSVIACSFISNPTSLPAVADEGSAPVSVVADEGSAPVNVPFSEWVIKMDAGEISKVTFTGINPKYLTALTNDGKNLFVKEGFPAFNDPMSASGPQQAIAKCQHTPGVICNQDISDLLRKSRTRDYSTKTPEMMNMLSHSSYPKPNAKGIYD